MDLRAVKNTVEKPLSLLVKLVRVALVIVYIKICRKLTLRFRHFPYVKPYVSPTNGFRISLSVCPSHDE